MEGGHAWFETNILTLEESLRNAPGQVEAAPGAPETAEIAEPERQRVTA